MANYQYTRRDFLQTMLAGVSAGAVMMSFQKCSSNGIPTRPLGGTGEQVSIICLGGWSIVDKLAEKESVALMHEAIGEGLTFFDNCWDYHGGESEIRMGKALAENSRRDKVFLMTKVCGRDYKTAKSNIEDSLRRLQTDRIDLLQFHAIKWEDDADLIFSADGALKAVLEAKQAGKVRYVGFTGHKDPKFHLNMLAQDYDWDTVQMPLNILDYYFFSFQKQVLPVCTERNIGILGMKALAAQNGRIIRDFGISAKDCRRYGLSLPVSSQVCGISSRENLLQDISIARNFTPMTEYEIKAILAEVKDEALTGSVEEYKTGNYGCDWFHKQVGES